MVNYLLRAPALQNVPLPDDGNNRDDDGVGADLVDKNLRRSSVVGRTTRRLFEFKKEG